MTVSTQISLQDVFANKKEQKMKGKKLFWKDVFANKKEQKMKGKKIFWKDGFTNKRGRGCELLKESKYILSQGIWGYHVFFMFCTGFVRIMETWKVMEFKYFSFQAWKVMEFNRWSWKVMKSYSILGMQIIAGVETRTKWNTGKFCQKIPENKDNFDNFRKWQLNFRLWKTGKSHGKGLGVWKTQKSMNPFASVKDSHQVNNICFRKNN